MGRSETEAVEAVLRIVNHEERLRNIKRILAVFEKDSALLSRRIFEALQKDLLFLVKGWGAMDHEHADAAVVLLRLKQIRRSKLFGPGKLDPETPAKPAAVIPNDIWNRFREAEEEEENDDNKS